MTDFDAEEVQRGFLSLAPDWLLFEKAEPTNLWVEVTGRLQGSDIIHVVGVRNDPPPQRKATATPRTMEDIGVAAARGLREWFEGKGHAPK